MRTVTRRTLQITFVSYTHAFVHSRLIVYCKYQLPFHWSAQVGRSETAYRVLKHMSQSKTTEIQVDSPDPVLSMQTTPSKL